MERWFSVKDRSLSVPLGGGVYHAIEPGDGELPLTAASLAGVEAGTAPFSSHEVPSRIFGVDAPSSTGSELRDGLAQDPT